MKIDQFSKKNNIFFYVLWLISTLKQILEIELSVETPLNTGRLFHAVVIFG